MTPKAALMNTQQNPIHVKCNVRIVRGGFRGIRHRKAVAKNGK